MIADTDAADFIYADADITAFFSIAGSNYHRAAAMATRSIASDRSRLAKRIKREGYETERQAIADILALADKFDEQALTSEGLVIDEFLVTDEHLDSYHPEWHDENTTDLI